MKDALIHEIGDGSAVKGCGEPALWWKVFYYKPELCMKEAVGHISAHLDGQGVKDFYVNTTRTPGLAIATGITIKECEEDEDGG
ncbi:MAG: hypothetical protein KAR06_02470 [Deltaproteobacteria bacterium]|nr:hypothetical protein [Deltaproteobacteria bacterium]